MDYRTDPLSITEAALPFLEWGNRHGKPVVIALETVRQAPEIRRYYGRAATGELLALDLGERSVLMLLARPVRLDGALVYERRDSIPVNFDGVSFNGKETRLEELAPQLERRFGAWQSFAGLAIHGLDQAH